MNEQSEVQAGNLTYEKENKSGSVASSGAWVGGMSTQPPSILSFQGTGITTMYLTSDSFLVKNKSCA